MSRLVAEMVLSGEINLSHQFLQQNVLFLSHSSYVLSRIIKTSAMKGEEKHLNNEQANYFKMGTKAYSIMGIIYGLLYQ